MIDFRQRKTDVVLLFELAKVFRRHLQRVGEIRFLLRSSANTGGDVAMPAGVLLRETLEISDDQGQEIGTHRHGLLEERSIPAVEQIACRRDGHVAPHAIVVLVLDGQGVARLQRWFVEAGQGAPGGDRFHLRRNEIPTRLVGRANVGTEIEAESVVSQVTEIDDLERQLPVLRQVLIEDQSEEVAFLVEQSSNDGDRRLRRANRIEDVNESFVENETIGRLKNANGDVHLSVEDRIAKVRISDIQVRTNEQIVMKGNGESGKTMAAALPSAVLRTEIRSDRSEIQTIPFDRRIDLVQRQLKLAIGRS